MIRFQLVLLAFGLCCSLASVEAQDCSTGQCSTAAGYAATMNARGLFRHDRAWGGAEVIYQSTGTATETEARAAWMRSPAHRRLLVSGAIQDVACVGGVCVGRSLQAVQNSLTKPFMQGVRNGFGFSHHRTPLKQIRSLIRCR
jgi:hypothetical protein